MSRGAKIENPKQLHDMLFGMMKRVGGSVEQVRYEIKPGVVWEGTQLYDCKEIHSTVLLRAKKGRQKIAD